jgi:hypothetical protein
MSSRPTKGCLAQQEIKVNASKLEVGQVGITFRGGNWQGQHAERIARMAIRQLQQFISQRALDAGKRTPERQTPRTVRVSAISSDEEIARATAAEVYRSLLER